MRIYLIRHSMTKGNKEKRYIGTTDESLCLEGIQLLEERKGMYPEVTYVYVSPMKRCVKILGFVASTDDFHEQAQVINSASQVFIDAFGEEGRHARSAIGSNALPLGLAVEVESIFEIEEA